MADGITVKLEGVEDLIRKVRSYQVITKEAIRIALVRGALQIELAAKEMCAVDTGRLRGSITTDKRYIQKFLVMIGTKVDYGPYVEFGTKKMCAVDTGRLRGSITTDKRYIQKFLVMIGTKVDYGPYVEFGTKKMDARPYLFPAFFMFEGEIVKDIKKILDKRLR